VHKPSYKLAFTLFLGVAGSLLAHWAGLPAPALIGSGITVTIGSLLKLTADIPEPLRNIAFVIIGCSLGAGVTHEALSQSAQWPVSLIILTLAMVAILLACSHVLVRFFNQTMDSALLSTSPGALGYVLALAAAGVGDIRAIAVIQSIRILLITTTLPFILVQFGGAPLITNPGSFPAMGHLEFTILFFISLGGGWFLNKIHVPAAFFLAGIIFSAIAHFNGLLIGRPSADIIFIGFTITGSLIGARFSTIPLSDLKKLLGASLAVLSLSVLIGACCALLVSRILSLPFGQVFVAFAPGGVEAMAAMALALGYDPAYVAAHHLFRIILLICVLPLLLKMFKKNSGG